MSFDSKIADTVDRDRIARARAMSGEEKLLAGPRLFDFSCRIMIDGIRDQFPDADDAEVQRILRERLALARNLEQSS